MMEKFKQRLVVIEANLKLLEKIIREQVDEDFNTYDLTNNAGVTRLDMLSKASEIVKMMQTEVTDIKTCLGIVNDMKQGLILK